MKLAVLFLQKKKKIFSFLLSFSKLWASNLMLINCLNQESQFSTVSVGTAGIYRIGTYVGTETR